MEYIRILSSVPDPNPDPPDPHVFVSPGSVSGSGSFYHQAKKVRKTLISFILWLLLDFLSSGSTPTCHGSRTLILSLTAKNQYRKLETNIPRKGISRPMSQFPQSCVCERFIYSIPTIDLSIILQDICGPILGIYKSLSDTLWKQGLRPRNSQKRNT